MNRARSYRNSATQTEDGDSRRRRSRSHSWLRRHSHASTERLPLVRTNDSSDLSDHSDDDVVNDPDWTPYNKIYKRK